MKTISLLACLLMTPSLGFAQDADAELHKKISKLEKEINALKKQAKPTAVDEATTTSADAEGATLKKVKDKVAAKSKNKPKTDESLDDTVRPLGSTRPSSARDVEDEVSTTSTDHLATDPMADDEITKPKKSPKDITLEGDDETTKKDFSNAEELYSQGQLYMRQRQIDKALNVLTQFTEKYSDSPQFTLASYWLGEVHLEKKDYTNASIAYGTAYSAYKKIGEGSNTATSAQRNKAAESLAKLAYCLKMMKKSSDGCTTLGQIDKEFKTIPKNLQVYIAGLKTELKCKK